VAKQGGRQPAASAQHASDARLPAALVTGWEADCFCSSCARKPDPNPHGRSGRRQALELTAEDHYETDPNWSPDQSSLVFGGVPWLEAGAPGSAVIHVLDLKTRQVSTLPGSEGLFSPHWSPDGRYVLAMSVDSRKLMLFDFSTHQWTELLNSPAAYPNWSHDGSYIYFSDPYTAEFTVHRVRISDRKLEAVTILSRQRLGWSTVGKWMGLAGDDSPLVLRDTGSEEIYALDWDAP